MYATYTTSRGHAIVAARLDLPAEWINDQHRRARAGVPDEVVFATKPQLAVQILTELHTAGQLPGWITGDEVYGNNPTLRGWCEQHQVGYVLGRALLVHAHVGGAVLAWRRRGDHAGGHRRVELPLGRPALPVRSFQKIPLITCR